MLKTLIKKQLHEILMSISVGSKKKKSVLVSILIYILLFAAFSMVFATQEMLMCEPIVNMGYEWLYLTYVCLMAVLVGTIGSIFNTYTTIYKAKDNDLLLSLPIKPSQIIFAKMFSEYIFCLFFSGAAMLPGIYLWNKAAEPGIQGILFAVLTWLVLGFFILTLCCALAFVVALIASRMRHTNIVVIVVSIAAIVAYFTVFSRAQEFLMQLIAESDKVAEKIHGAGYPLYCLGMGSTGSISHFFITVAIIFALFVLCYFIISKSFYKIATANKGAVKKVYSEKTAKEKSAVFAIMTKEFKKLLSSPSYFLNSAMGLVFVVIGSIVIAVKKQYILSIMYSLAGENGNIDGMITLAACALVGGIMGFNSITATSVSLEGKNWWILKSLPISAWDIIKAKLGMGLSLSLGVGVFSSIVISICFFPGVINILLIFAFSTLFICFSNLFGMAMGIRFPRLDWTNEITVIKQSMAVLITMFTGFFVIILLVAAFALFGDKISPSMFAFLAIVMFLVFDLLLLYWLKTSGVKRIEAL